MSLPDIIITQTQHSVLLVSSFASHRFRFPHTDRHWASSNPALMPAAITALMTVVNQHDRAVSLPDSLDAEQHWGPRKDEAAFWWWVFTHTQTLHMHTRTYSAYCCQPQQSTEPMKRPVAGWWASRLDRGQWENVLQVNCGPNRD